MQPIALITGGSRGIGAATAVRAARCGFAIAINYQRNADAAAAVVRQVETLGMPAIAVQADVADEAQVLAMFQAIDARLGQVTALVNNAGVVDVAARVDAMDVQRLRRMFDTNVWAALSAAARRSGA